METAIQQLNLFPITKADRAAFVQKCVEEITSGFHNPLKLEILLKNLEDTISEIRKNRDVKMCIQDEVDKYGDKSFDFENVSITKSERKSFMFNLCGDPEYDRLSAELEQVKAQLKAREEFLKALPMDVADPETGAIITKPVYQCTPYLTIKFK